MIRPKRLIVADPGLRTRGGHHLVTSLGIAAAARRAGFEVTTWAHQSAELDLPVAGIKRLFRQDTYVRPIEFGAQFTSSASGPPASVLAQDVFRGILESKARADDIIFFHTMSLTELLLLFDIVHLLPVAAIPPIAVLLRYEEEPYGEPMPLWAYRALAARYGNAGLVGRLFFLFAETKALASAIGDMLSLPVAALPHFTDVVPTQRPSVVQGRPLRVVVLGASRSEKRVGEVPKLVRALSVGKHADLDLEFHVQVTASTADVTEKGLAAILGDLRSPDIVHPIRLYGYLDDRAYSDLTAQADVVLLLHDGDRFRNRGSATLVDGLASGAIVLCDERMSAAREWGGESVLTFRSHEEIVDRLADLAGNAAETEILLERAFARAAGLQESLTADRCLLRIRSKVDSDRAAAGEKRKVALHIAPNWTGQGSSYVFQAQINYLASRGYDVYCVHVATWPVRAMSWSEQAAHTDAAAHRCSSYQWFVGASEQRSSALARLGRQNGFWPEGRWAYEVELPETLLSFVARNPPDLLVVNYSYLMPLAARLGLDGSRTWLETHDLRAGQYALVENRDVDADEVALEDALAARAQLTVFINDEERAAATARNSDLVAVTAHAIRPRDAPSGELTGDELIDLRANKTPSLREAYSGAGHPARVLFVGSGHHSNVASLRWFLDLVIARPEIADLCEVTVAGSIAAHVKPADYPDVRFTGFAKSLNKIYELSDIIVLPIVAGTGLPIKAVEAVQYEKPIVATSNCFRAIPEAGQYLPLSDTPDDFYLDLFTLCANRSAREERRRQVIRFKEEVLNEARYFSILDRALGEAAAAQALPRETWHGPQQISLGSAVVGRWSRRHVDELAATLIATSSFGLADRLRIEMTGRSAAELKIRLPGSDWVGLPLRAGSNQLALVFPAREVAHFDLVISSEGSRGVWWIDAIVLDRAALSKTQIGDHLAAGGN